MTNEEKELSQARFQQILQAVNNTDDINVWQNQRRSDGLSFGWQDWKDARERALSELKSSAEYSQQQHHADLDTERLERAEESERLALEPEKQMLMRQWLADHPGKT